MLGYLQFDNPRSEPFQNSRPKSIRGIHRKHINHTAVLIVGMKTHEYQHNIIMMISY